MGDLFFKVFGCFVFGMAAPILTAFFAEILLGSHLYEWLFFTSWGVIVLVSFGLTGVALAIWDGQFIGNVKPTHWISRPKDPSASR